MSTPEKEPIPEWFEKWMESDCPNWAKYDAGSGQKASWSEGAKAAYRHLSSQKATPSDGSETEDEKTYRKLSEWYLKQLRECQDELRAIKSSQPSPGLSESELHLRSIIERAYRYLREMNDDNVHDPSVGLYSDRHLVQLIDDIGALAPITEETPSAQPTGDKTEK